MKLLRNLLITPNTPEVITQLETLGFTQYSNETHTFKYVTITDPRKITGASNISKMRKVIPNDKFIHMITLLQLNDDPHYRRMIMGMY